MPSPLDVGKRFAEERERLDLSRADLAFAAGYSAEQIRKVELGERMPGGELLAALLALRGDVAYVLAAAPSAGEVRDQPSPSYFDTAPIPTMEEMAIAKQAARIKAEKKEWSRMRDDRRKKVLTDDEADLVETYRELGRMDRARLLENAEKMRNGEPPQARAGSVIADRGSVATGGDLNIGHKSGRRKK